MNSQVVIISIALVYFALMVVIGVWANRHTSSTEDFLVAGGSLGFFVMAVAVSASALSGWGMIGGTGTVYSWGLAGFVAVTLFTPVGFALSWFLLGTRLYRAAQRHEIYSVPDFIKLRYGNRAAHISMSVALALGSIAYMTAQIGAMGLLMQIIFGFPFSVGVWVGSFIVASYTIAGGMLAAVWTDLVQGILMVAMAVLVFLVAVFNGGGWGDTLSTVASEDPAFVSAVGAGSITWLVAAIIMTIFGNAGQPHIIHKFLMLRDERELRWGAVVAGVTFALASLFIFGVGLAVRAAVIDGSIPALDNIDNVAPYFLNNMVNPVVGGLALAGLLAAIMSSSSSFITIGASAVMRDLAGGLGIRVRRELLWGRIWAGIIVLASVLVGLYLDQIIFLAGAFGWAAFAAAIFGPIVFGLYWRRATGVAAVATIIVGILINLSLTGLTARGVITLPEYFFVGGFSVVFCMLLFIVVSYLTSSSSDQERFDSLYPEVEVGSATERSRRESTTSGGGVIT